MAEGLPWCLVTRTVRKTEPSWTGRAGRRKGPQKFGTGEELELGTLCHLPIGVTREAWTSRSFSAPTRATLRWTPSLQILCIILKPLFRWRLLSQD